MKSIIFWDMTPCSLLSYNRRFGGTYRLHLQERRNNFSKNQQASSHSGSRISQAIQRRATGWTAGVRFPREAKDFSLLRTPQTGSGAHPASYSKGSGGSFLGPKRLGLEANHSPPPNAEVKNGGAVPPLRHTSLWRRAKLIKRRDNFTFTLT
jgi:hypothetical protein